MASSTVGFVYVLANLRMPGLVKIGRTQGLTEDRARALLSAAPTTVSATTAFGGESASRCWLARLLKQSHGSHRGGRSPTLGSCERPSPDPGR